MANTATITPMRITLTLSQFLAWMANTSGAPMPPAPTSPRVEALLTAISKWFRERELYMGISCGILAKNMVCQNPAPTAVMASTGLSSMASISSVYSLPSIPI